MLQDIYVLTKWNSQGELNLASNPKRMELPIYFSRSQAEYFFNFAETRIACNPGEEVVLLKGGVKLDALTDGYDLMKLIAQGEDFNEWEVISRKKRQILVPPATEAKWLRI
ncbi:MAG: hypothetical protein ACRBB4_16420 [Neptuniibacter sp.]